MTKRSWMELSPRSRMLVVVLGVVEVALFVAAQADLARRPADQVSASKARWRLLTMINFIGPIAYFVRGRRAPTVT